MTRTSIIDAARLTFAERGFAATTVASLAETADLAPSAIYHYFGGKAELYEAVFEETVEGIWSDLGSAARSHPTLRAGIDQMLTDTRQLSQMRPNYADFMALVPMEARLNSRFGDLLLRRAKYQDETFGALARLGIATGELAGFTEYEATEIVRSVIMGWFFESHFRSAHIPGSVEAILAMFDRIAQS